jgi:hypothetical protein
MPVLTMPERQQKDRDAALITQAHSAKQRKLATEG